MLTRILAAGLVGGTLGGIAITFVQTVSTIPLILQAETFEMAAAQEMIVHLVHGGVSHAHEAGAGSSALEPVRLALTLVATVAVATGYAWMLLAAMVARGEAITARSVVPWAAAAFFAAGLAPAFGLAPELPGAAAADLGARQAWWLFAAVFSAGGLAAIFLGRSPMWVPLGVAALLLPHLVGAPHPDGVASSVPAEVAARFASASLMVQLLMWVVPGVIAGYAISRSAKTA